MTDELGAEPDDSDLAVGDLADGEPAGDVSGEGIDLKEHARGQILDAMGGWSGTVVASIPTLVFVITNAIGSLSTAIYAAIAAAVLCAGYRIVRREPIQQAIMGLVSVAFAAFIAWRMGEARGFFVVGIATSIAYASVFAISLLVRRPIVGVAWEFLEPSPLPEGQHWHQIPTLRRAYSIATLAGFGMFAARALVQGRLFQENKTGLLAVTKIAMGFPLYIAVVALGFWVVRRARRQLPGVEDTDQLYTS
jgi:hypothetical protein